MIRGKISGCDPCKSDWKAKINELWAKYQSVVKTITFMGHRYYPDGDGNIEFADDLIITGYIGLADNSTFWTLLVADSPSARLINNTTYYTLEVI